MGADFFITAIDTDYRFKQGVFTGALRNGCTGGIRYRFYMVDDLPLFSTGK